MIEWKILNKFVVKEMSHEDFDPLFEKFHKTVFSETQNYDLLSNLNEEERRLFDNLKKSKEDRFELLLGIFHGKKFIGWHMGWQHPYYAYYMANTGIIKEYRRQGIYSEILEKIKKWAREKGFQEVWSSHLMTNNPVLIAKMKSGFMINGFEVSPRFGILVNMKFFFNDLANKIIDYKVGKTNRLEI